MTPIERLLLRNQIMIMRAVPDISGKLAAAAKDAEKMLHADVERARRERRRLQSEE